MKRIFKKADLGLIDSVVHKTASGRDNWTLAAKMKREDGFCRGRAAEIMLLSRGAEAGDVWSMCELARSYYFDTGYVCMPLALSWWCRAARLGDGGARDDLARLDSYIIERIKQYEGGGTEYENIIARCAMLAEYYLSDIGRTEWSLLSDSEHMERIVRLANAVCDQFGIRHLPIYCEENLMCNGALADGVAHPDKRIGLRLDVTRRKERLIQVLYHEIGHHIMGEMWDRSSESARLIKLLNISEERIQSWYRGDNGIEVPVWEEDPDTISYLVYTQWAVFFADAVPMKNGG